MMTPLIGISTNVAQINSGPFTGNQRVFVNRGYVESVIEAGGIPLLLPILADPKAIQAHLSLIQGLIISGGHDVDPSHYGEPPHPLLEETSAERDFFELELIQQAHRLGIPILGICRGMQLMNVAFGGSLYQHLPDHRPEEGAPIPNHSISLTPHTPISEIFKTDTLIVNSVHHQGIKKLAPGFKAAALSADGLIEAIYLEGLRVMGVQWHPEVKGTQNDMDPLFRAFIAQAKRR